MGEFDYDHRVYLNLLAALENLSAEHVKDSEQFNIFFIGWPIRESYTDISRVVKGRNNILYIYSHPWMIGKRHLQMFGERLKIYASVPVIKNYLLKKTGFPSEILPPASSLLPLDKKIDQTIDLAFIGGIRKRPIVEDSLSIVKRNKLHLVIFGHDWGNSYRGSKEALQYWAGEAIRYEEIPRLSAQTKIFLLDHLPEMRKMGIVSHKYIDLIMSGAFVISDNNKGVEELGGVTYLNRKDLENKIRYFLGHPEEAGKIAKKQFAMIKPTYNNAFSAREIYNYMESVQKASPD